jgi:hypothetical protein
MDRGGRANPGFAEIVESGTSVLDVRSAAPGPSGSLPLTAEMLRDSPSIAQAIKDAR